MSSVEELEELELFDEEDEELEELELLDEEDEELEELELLDEEEDEPPVEELPPLIPFLAIPEGVVIVLGMVLLNIL